MLNNSVFRPSLSIGIDSPTVTLDKEEKGKRRAFDKGKHMDERRVLYMYG